MGGPCIVPAWPFRVYGKKYFPHDCAGLWFAYRAHPAPHIEIRVDGCHAESSPQDKQEVELYFIVGPYPAGRLFSVAPSLSFLKKFRNRRGGSKAWSVIAGVAMRAVISIEGTLSLSNIDSSVFCAYLYNICQQQRSLKNITTI